jgi:biotin operon repressor
MNIERFIPEGKENAISREVLARRLGLTDRQTRKLIEEARDRGVLIVNDCDGEGYYLACDLGQIERQYRKDRSRALSVLKRLKTMRRMLRDAGKEV